MIDITEEIKEYLDNEFHSSVGCYFVRSFSHLIKEKSKILWRERLNRDLKRGHV